MSTDMQDVHSGVHYYQGETMFVGPRRLSVGSHLLEAELILLACDIKADDFGLKWTVNLICSTLFLHCSFMYSKLVALTYVYKLHRARWVIVMAILMQL